MNRKLLVFAGIAVVVVGLPMLAKLGRGETGKQVETEAVAVRAVRSSILASGVLAYRDEVELRSEVIGKAQQVNVREGDSVRRGDVIIALDPEQYRAQVEQQQANVRMQEIAIERQQVLLSNLERQVERQRELFKRGLLDQNAFEAAENELALARVDLRTREEALAQARAALAQAQDNLDRTQIRSPIDGVVIMLDVEPGEAVIAGTTNIPGTTLAIIADPSAVLAEVQVDETDIAAVTLGQKAAIFAAAFPDTALEAVVEHIAASAQQATGQQNLSFQVKIRLLQPEQVALRPGMSCRAEIYTESSENALAVPLQAVLYEAAEEGEDEQPYLFVVEDGKAVKRKVKTGLSSDSHLEIVEGVEAGERVVIGPFRTLRSLADGERVTAENEDE
ncbi:MAG TPA: efflux RND transporter periplasmic adaptor subunit [Gammaproteobacteria bacterium]|nr:efflux RND transporter periplasmic adaptor subunit [Gammaproteobacteria bacterium]